MPRYEADNLFDTSKFMMRVLGFRLTGYWQGLESMFAEWKTTSALKKEGIANQAIIRRVNPSRLSLPEDRLYLLRWQHRFSE
ncbi:hypothetical protein AABV68_003981 [Enterobacter ludwigii]|jgi:hypothetical protein